MLILFSILEKHLLLLTSFLDLTDWSKKKSLYFFCLLKESSILTVFFFSPRESLNRQVSRILRVKVTVNVKAKNDIWDSFFSFHIQGAQFINEDIMFPKYCCYI